MTMKKERINHYEFVADVRKRLEVGLAKYGSALHISGNMGAGSIFAEIEPTFGLAVKLAVDADLLRDPEGGAVKTTVTCSCSHQTPGFALLMASMMQDAANLALLIEAAYDSKLVFFEAKCIVELTAVGDKKIEVIKLVRAITGLPLKEAKDFVDAAPKNVGEALPRIEAEAFKARLEAQGAIVTLK